mmetsp:Transcript_20336/g.39945  ORF Transcript_20336/g.39945 Transcript_20336/m.39945 type:complete len:571 (+) Transcript_20336:361-2073(+)
MRLGILTVLVVACVQLVYGQTDDSTSSTNLKVVSPAKLKTALQQLNSGDSVYHKDAMFGTPSKQNIIGEIEYVTSGDTDGCSDSYQVTAPKDQGVNRIFMVDRGDCTFTTKARIAQSKGANGLIVVNNECLSSRAGLANAKTLCSSSYSSDVLPYMAYDNSGDDITIPAFLIPMYDGQLLKDCLAQSAGADGSGILSSNSCASGSKVIMNMELNVPALNKVSWEVWQTADSLVEQLSTVGIVDEAFRKFDSAKYEFNPRYLFFADTSFGCEMGMCPDLCKYSSATDKGYCSIPVNMRSRAMNGAEIVAENIRQKCIFKVHSSASIWWNFMTQFEAMGCSYEDLASSQTMEECSKTAAKAVTGFDETKVTACVNNPSQWESLVQKDAQQMKDEAIFTTQLAINGVREDFSHTPRFITWLLCQSFDTANRPGICSCALDVVDSETFRHCVSAKCATQAGTDQTYYCVETGECLKDAITCRNRTRDTVEEVKKSVEEQSTGMSGGKIFLIVLMCVGTVGAGAFVYHKRQRRQMQEEVRDILSEYMPLEELNSFSGHNSNGFSRAPTDDTVGVI